MVIANASTDSSTRNRLFTIAPPLVSPVSGASQARYS
jgi:hypothetical protein